MSVLFTRRGPAPGSGGGGGISGTVASDLEIGSSVYLKVNGTLKEFLVVHQGKPSSMYDNSCDGTWLLMKDIYENRVWHSSTRSNYGASSIHTYLNGTFLNLFDSAVQSAIKQVKIPYATGSGSTWTVASGSNGLSTKIFLLGGYELGWTQATSAAYPIDGACLSYFNGTSASNGASASKRVAYLNGSAGQWWLRSTDAGTISVWRVHVDGSNAIDTCEDSHGVRPALILPSNALFDPSTKEFVGVA